ncbi:MAG: DNA helicase RecQ [Muribaculaceae bacterium]|nr:DNA helicase RecQ [Muribaculaceae bacterium]
MADIQQIHDALRRHFGFEKFKGNQLAVIEALLDGRDVFVLMPTGGGKSLCYQLPALMAEGTAVVISPLIALMKNQVDALRQHCCDNSVAHFLNSSLTRTAADEVKRDVMEGRTKLLYVAPESLAKEENVRFLKKVKVSFYAVDEAHCISEWGHDFRPDYRHIRPRIRQIGVRPVIALTATATPKVQHDIMKSLGIRGAQQFHSSFNRPNLYYEVRPKTKHVDADIIRFIKANPGKSGIVYCLSRKKVEEMAELLKINGIKALAYHAGMEGPVRSENQDAFLHEKIDVIVATIAFGMGIDKPDVRYVIHYDIPKSLEGYYQETGRAGRDGGEGRCITFFTRKDLVKLEKLIQTKKPEEQEISRQLLAEAASYAESSVCRRRILLNYFGEDYDREECGNCDNCLNPKTKVEAKDQLCALIETVMAVKENFKPEYVIQIMVGRKTDEIKANHHDRLDVFGSTPDCDDRFLASVVRQAVIAGYLSRDIENYGILHATAKGRKYLNSPVSFKVTEDNDFNELENEPQVRGSGSGAADMELFSILKDMRRQLARTLDLPPYVIFQDPSLEAMATTYPVTVEELCNVPGVGKGKAERYGKEFLDVIRRHVEENEIVRPEDFRVRTLSTSYTVKLDLVRSIDRKIDLEELADSKGMEFCDLLDELESIVDAGHKINIDYYLLDIMEPDDVEEVMDYFRDTEEDDLDAAIAELGDAYSEEEIRLVRIKFMSELGN